MDAAQITIPAADATLLSGLLSCFSAAAEIMTDVDAAVALWAAIPDVDATA